MITAMVNDKDYKQAFSLVELSIVLVILGLLTGGILTGQNLIRAAELRSVITESKNYQTAVMTFRDKYFALPGDMRNATDFWGEMTNCASGNSSGTDTETCNGDGDGKVEAISTANRTSEELQFWRQLTNAGLIEGSYSGVVSGAGLVSLGSELPYSRMSNAGWRLRYLIATTNMFNVDYGNNTLHLSTVSLNSEVFTPEEAWNIDKKMDDGLPGQGKIIGRSISACSTGASTDVNDFDLPYDLQSSSKDCTLYFRKVF
jgi:prepilin-type N-terminal cleavage/methylation domain-containing protein